MEFLNLKSVFIFIVLFISISTSNAESELQTDNATYSTNNSSVIRNIAIVIDASGSTALGDAATGLTFIGFIHSNSINIIQNVAPDTRVGIVAFSGITAQTDILLMDSEANKSELKKFIMDSSPKGGENPTDINKGLRAAEELLNSASCMKQIIIISDGMIHPDGFDQAKNTVIDLKNKGINIHFVQVLTSYEPPGGKAYKLYNDLALAADEQVIVLYPNEGVPKSVFESKEPCSTYIAIPTITPTVTTTPITTPTPSPTLQLEQEVKELKERLNKVEEKQNQSWFESSINSILDWFKTIF